MAGAPARVVGSLGVAQTLAWGSSYYLPAMLAAPMARELGVTTPTIYAAFSGALVASALVGPAQVAARMLEFGFLRNVHPLLSARLATLAHPIGAAVLLAAGPALASVFAVLHGAGNGILTIAKGTLPLALFGAQGYGARQGWLMLPARVAQALAPFLFGLALDAWGASALWLSSALGAAALAALLLLRAPPTPSPAHQPG